RLRRVGVALLGGDAAAPAERDRLRNTGHAGVRDDRLVGGGGLGQVALHGDGVTLDEHAAGPAGPELLHLAAELLGGARIVLTERHQRQALVGLGRPRAHGALELTAGLRQAAALEMLVGGLQARLAAGA